MSSSPLSSYSYIIAIAQRKVRRRKLLFSVPRKPEETEWCLAWVWRATAFPGGGAEGYLEQRAKLGENQQSPQPSSISPPWNEFTILFEIS